MACAQHHPTLWPSQLSSELAEQSQGSPRAIYNEAEKNPVFTMLCPLQRAVLTGKYSRDPGGNGEAEGAVLGVERLERGSLALHSSPTARTMWMLG